MHEGELVPELAIDRSKLEAAYPARMPMMLQARFAGVWISLVSVRDDLHTPAFSERAFAAGGTLFRRVIGRRLSTLGNPTGEPLERIKAA